MVLEEEIVTRYYLDKGTVEASFNDDLQLQAAINILKDPGQYAQLLDSN